MLEKMKIKSAQGDYHVHFLDGALGADSELNALKPSHFVIDENVYRLHKGSLDKLVQGRPMHLIEATEETKTLHGVEKFATFLQKNGANRSSVVVAVGGGITQDLACFTSHNYYRGIPWVFFPTTLLSMCDSSIGAKCGINLNEFKNQLGVFQSPKAVFTCSEFLSTLPEFHVSSGYGEILKLYLTDSDWGLLDELEGALAGGLRNPKLLALIRTSLEIKKKVIEADEYEADYRRVLNYGHSFGHSLEAITNHEIPHGLAVAWGLDLINFMGVQRGLLSESRFNRIHELIRNHLPFKLSGNISTTALINGARKDKKTDNTGINLVFLTDSGKLEIKKVPFDEMLQGHVESYLSSRNVYALS